MFLYPAIFIQTEDLRSLVLLAKSFALVLSRYIITCTWHATKNAKIIFILFIFIVKLILCAQLCYILLRNLGEGVQFTKYMYMT